MGFGVSTTRDGITYSISGDDFGSLVANIQEVGGITGLMGALAEAPYPDKAMEVVKEAFGDVTIHDTVPEAPVEPEDELADLIRNAPDVKALTALWRAHKAKWNGDYNKLADMRKRVLEKKG